MAIASTILRQIPFIVVSEVQSYFIFLNSTKEQHPSNLGTHFDALVSKFNSHGDKFHFLEPWLAFQLLVASNVVDLHRGFFLAGRISKNSVLDETHFKKNNAVLI